MPTHIHNLQAITPFYGLLSEYCYIFCCDIIVERARLSTEYCRVQNNSFLRNNFKSRHIAISRQPNNRYFKLYVIPVIDNYCILLTIKLLPPLRKGKLLLIHICLFKNHHKCYPSNFDRYTPRINFFIQPLDVPVCSSSEKVSCDSFRLW